MTMHQPIVARTLETADRVNAVESSPSVSVEDLEPGKQAMAQVHTVAGTAVLHIEWSPDGTNWTQLGANLTDASTFPLFRDLVDAGGNDLPSKYIRLRASALAGGGIYGITAHGRQRAGYR